MYNVHKYMYLFLFSSYSLLSLPLLLSFPFHFLFLSLISTPFSLYLEGLGGGHVFEFNEDGEESHNVLYPLLTLH